MNKIEQAVKRQYEKFPYPDYGDIKKIETIFHTQLNFISHHCFKGCNDFSDFSVLDAGCGTGKALISIAKQLSTLAGNHRVVGADLSSASLDRAKKYATQHNVFDDIEFKQTSILDLPALCESGEIPLFDYIISYGVVHHTENPTETLNALKKCLKPNGVMYIMMYATYARLLVQPLHDFMTTITDSLDESEQINIARAVLEDLPENNLFKIVSGGRSDAYREDSHLYDLLLHRHFKTFTVPELLNIVNNAQLKFISFTKMKRLYNPDHSVTSDIIRNRIKQHPIDIQWKLCEEFQLQISNHEFLLTHPENNNHPDTLSNAPSLTPTIEEYRDYIPTFSIFYDYLLSTTIVDQRVRKGRIRFPVMGDSIIIEVNRAIYEFVKRIDNISTIGELAATCATRLKIDVDTVMNDIKPFLDITTDNLMIMLQHSDYRFRAANVK